MTAIHKIKTILTLNKPAYGGMCILEFRKVPTYKTHLKWIDILATNLDYDSQIGLMYEAETKNVYEDFRKNKEMFDFSNYFS